MRPPKFKLVQSKMLAPIVATFFLLDLRTFLPPHFARAVELSAPLADSTFSQPVLHAAPDALSHLQDGSGDEDGPDGYAPDFDYFDRSLLGRQASQEPLVIELENNEKKEVDIAPGTTAYFVLKRGQSRAIRADDDALETLEARGTGNTSGDPLDQGVLADADTDINDVGEELKKRQTRSRVWISANTCRQPGFTEGQTPKNHPQLVMYVSATSRNQKPGPNSTEGLATPPSGVLFDNGFASFELNSTSDVYIGIAAPNLEEGWFGSWHFEVAASLDGSYYSYNATNPFLFLIDRDSDSALFITYSLNEPNTTDADKWKENNPFRMYAWPIGDGTNITGMEHSLCALKNLNNQTDTTVLTSITTKFGDNLPKSQFHVQGLKNGTKYNGYLTVEGGSDVLQLPRAGTVRGGGKVFQQFEFSTKFDDSCQVIYDLEFCDSVAYAVPSSDKYKLDNDGLKGLYDNQAKAYYKNFSNSLAQVACDTTSEAQYSLARTCKHCDQDYRNWLCSVLIPRCEDWRAQDDWLQERNVNALLPDGSLTYEGNVSVAFNETIRDRFAYSKSRNPMIDEVIKPGPYKEMKPCEDLCFDIVRSCPAKLQFACPNSPARELSYGKRDPEEKELKCNFPGAVVKLNVQGAANSLSARVWILVMVALVAAATPWT